MRPKAFLFDLNGTMIDDMEYHAKAWSGILNDDLKAGLTPQQVKVQMYGKNSEVLNRIFGEGRFNQAEMDALSIEKENRYQRAYKPVLKLIAGLDKFMEKAKQHGIAMAIGSAAIPYNIDFVLDNLHIRHYFRAIVSADDVTTSKPDPETFLKAAKQLNILPSECVVFEDAPKGVESAANAGMKSVVLTTMHEAEEFKAYSNIIGFAKDYDEAWLEKLF